MKKHLIEIDEAQIIQLTKLSYRVDFNHDEKRILGTCSVTKEDGKLFAVFNIGSSKGTISGFPSICFTIDKHTGIRTLLGVSICSTENVDEKIKSINL